MDEILVKIKCKKNINEAVSIGIKSQYKEFSHVEEAFAWIFENASQIEEYDIYTIEKFTTKKDPTPLSDSICLRGGDGHVGISAPKSYATFD